MVSQVNYLLTDPEIAGKTGIVRVEEQRRIWHDCPNLVQEFLLRMMDHFDLAYRTETHPVHSIVVELSPEDRTADVNPLWEKAAEESDTSGVALDYRFETTIPPGLPTWFIARSHRFTTSERHWRRGGRNLGAGGIPVGETRGQAFAFYAAPAVGGDCAAGAGLLGRVGESAVQAVSLSVAVRGTCEAAFEGVRG